MFITSAKESLLEGYSDVHFGFNQTLYIIYVTVDDCTCYEAGNYYQPVSFDGCESFTQRTAYLPEQTQNCSESLLFDVTICRCNYANLVSCPAYCQGTTTPLPTTTTPKSICIHDTVYALQRVMTAFGFIGLIWCSPIMISSADTLGLLSGSW